MHLKSLKHYVIFIKLQSDIIAYLTNLDWQMPIEFFFVVMKKKMLLSKTVPPPLPLPDM